MKEQNERLKIFKKLNRRLTYPDITKGVYVRDDFTHFSERKMFENKVSILLPDSFMIMPQEMIDKKYPYDKQPQLIWTSQDFCDNMLFNLTNKKITNQDFQIALTQYQMLIKRSRPDNVFYEKILKPHNRTMLGWFDYKSYVIDGQLYNLLFMTSIEEMLFFGIFNCKFEDYIEWETYIPQMLNSIKDINSCSKNHLGSK